MISGRKPAQIIKCTYDFESFTTLSALACLRYFDKRISWFFYHVIFIPFDQLQLQRSSIKRFYSDMIKSRSSSVPRSKINKQPKLKLQFFMQKL